MSNHRGRFDHLFGARHNGSQSWRDRLTDAERAWFDELVDAVIDWGQEPNWKLSVEDFTAEFGADRAPASTTMSLHVRAAVKERSDGK